MHVGKIVGWLHSHEIQHRHDTLRWNEDDLLRDLSTSHGTTFLSNNRAGTDKDIGM